MKQQGFSTTVFCKISVRRSKYCLEFSTPVTVPFMFNFRSSCNKFPTIVWSLIFRISLPRLKLFFAQKGCKRVSQNRYQLPSEKNWTHEIEAKCARPVQDGVRTVESHNGYVSVKSKLQHAPPPGKTPGHLTFLKIIVQIPPYPGQNAVQMPHTRVH